MVIPKEFFNPKSVAIVGASKDKTKPGHLLLYSLLKAKFKGKIYPVNPKADKILGLKVYKNLEVIPGKVSIAIVATPAYTIPEILESCGRKNIGCCIITTSGFSESGTEEGKKLETEILNIARRNNVRLIGPNCMGIYNPKVGMAFFPWQKPEPGPVGFISQSGSIASMFCTISMEKGVRFSKVISSGNELDLNCADFLEYFGEDPETKIILAYIEGVKDGRRFLDVAKKISKEKPLIIWKAGLTSSGSKAASSHTGSLTGLKHVWDAVVKQTGIISVDGIEELLDLTLMFMRYPSAKTEKVAIVGGPGGIVVSAADACDFSNLTLAKLEDETMSKLKKILPPAGTSVLNPVDLGFGSVEWKTYNQTLKFLDEDPNVDVIMAIAGAPTFLGKSFFKFDEFAKGLAKTSKTLKKPLVAVMPEISQTQKPLKTLIKAGIPTYPTPIRAAKTLAKTLNYQKFKEKF